MGKDAEIDSVELLESQPECLRAIPLAQAHARRTRKHLLSATSAHPSYLRRSPTLKLAANAVSGLGHQLIKG